MGCNCGGASFQIDDSMVAADQPPVVGDPSYFWTGSSGGVTSDNAEGLAQVVPVWNPETAKTEEVLSGSP